MQKTVLLKTNLGDITIELDFDKAPVTSQNFADYVNDGFFDSTIFHRVISGFMIQGGGFTEDMKQKSGREPIVNEASNGLSNKRGSISMARTSNPNSATSQFFINLVDNNFLDYQGAANAGYAVFGRVTKGMETVDKIAQVETGRRGFHDDVPCDAVVIESAAFVD